ncbi:MAG: helix-turn-helix transcriptional regulator [Cyanobacteria bacterium J06626_6]
MPKKRKVPIVEVLRKKADLTQEGLAQALGITDHTYRNWIKGRSEPTMSIRQMKLLCNLLGCTLDDLPDDFTQSEASEQ